MALFTTLATAGTALYESGALSGGGSNNYFGAATRTSLCPASMDPERIARAMANSPARESERIRSIVTNREHRRTWDPVQIAIITGGGEQCKPRSEWADWAVRDVQQITDWVNRWAGSAPVAEGYGNEPTDAAPSGDTDQLKALADDVIGTGRGLLESLLTGGVREARYAAAGARAGVEGGRSASLISGNTVLIVVAAIVVVLMLRR